MAVSSHIKFTIKSTKFSFQRKVSVKMIKLKTPEEIEKIAVSGKILSVILKAAAENAVIGARLRELDELARRL